jgi:integrase
MEKLDVTAQTPQRQGYWATHEYYRLNVKDFVEEFVGWTAIMQLFGMLYDKRDKSFFAYLFLTGGRATEVLALRKSNFEVRPDKNAVLVRNMKLLKRYKKISELVKADGSKGWVTEKLVKFRKTFPIMLNEPLTPILLEWVESQDDLLFPSPRGVNDKGEALPLTRGWAYKLIRWVDNLLPEGLRESLRLNIPFISSNGVKVNDSIHLWLHWFRSQRASQLVNDYGYEVLDLMNYFSWEKAETAIHYARRGWVGLAEKMESTKISYR